MTIKEILNLARHALFDEKNRLYELQKTAIKYNYRKVIEHCQERIQEINIKIDQINTLDKAYQEWGELK